MEKLKSSGRPFDISKQEVWNAWLKVKANQGGPGVDGQSLEAFDADLKNNLYKEGYSRESESGQIWMSGQGI